MTSDTHSVIIRPAEPSDLQLLVDIYNHYITNTHVTFDTEPFTVESRTPWFEAFARAGPYRLLVATSAGHVVGYASSVRFKPKPAYSTSVETSIYVDSESTGRGVGHKLYSALVDALREEATVHRAYGGVALPNSGSIALHERLGFELVATYHEVGYKFGKYWDVSWFEKDLAD